MGKKLSTEEFIEKAKKVFPEYDYSLVNYISAYDKVKIICPNCGEQSIKATYLISGRGCKCFKNRYTCKASSKKPNIEEINKKFPDFEIDWTTYKSCMENLKIKCTICNNTFERNFNALKSKNAGCPWCSGNYKSIKTVLNELNDKYGNELFDFSLITKYNNNREKKQIICKKCNNIFYSDMHDMLSEKGRKCPYCNDESKGEREIRIVLEKKGLLEHIDFIRESRFEDCKDIKTLPFDFYLPKHNILIEYQGEQHYEKRFGGKSNLILIQKHDKIKKEFANTKGIKLLKIPYWEFKNIGKIINENIKAQC